MKTLLLLVGLLLSWESGRAILDKELQEMSAEGSKYVNKEIKNALKEVKQIKTQIEQTNEERKLLLSSLEEAKKKKEDALNDTRDSENKLKASQGVCNETMTALWEECKPCLKQTCMKFYARVCRSGSGLVGHQLEEFLNQSSPFYFWINGDRIDSLMENDREQSHVMDVMEDSFTRASSIMDELFQDRFFPRRPQDTQYYSPFSSFPRGSLFFNPKSHFARNVMPFPLLEPLNFHDVFQPFYDMIHQAQQAMDAHLQRTPYHFPVTEFTGEKEGDDDRTVCKEIRHNSTGCLRMKDQCEKCQEILEVDCSASSPTQTLLRQQLNASLQLAEKFSRLYDQLLQSYQQKMLDTSALLKQLNEQFTWVSQLANLTQSDDQYYLQVFTVNSHSSDPSIPSGLTKVVVKLFNSFPITVTVPQEVSSPNFMENVAERALQQYRRKSHEE
ncbi:clusterin isoform X3 [Capricornis sumatraensis]|uniref:clusterin isoform X3 n=1 Tax=Capricornis sumatraensis TaxID=34865 RepID=UPI0036050ACF